MSESYNSPLISVIIPIYNVEQYLDECVTSVLNQTYKNLEIILVNDGSLDRCGKMCDEYARHHDKIVVIHKENGGLASARDAGITQAVGDYVIFIDSDDFLLNQHCIQKIATAINQSSADVFLYGMCKYSDSTGTYQNSNVLPVKECKYTLQELINTNRYKASACDKAIKRDSILKHNIRFERELTIFAEDWGWCADIIMLDLNVEYLPECIYVYRQRYGTLSKSTPKKKLDDIIAVLTNYIDLKVCDDGRIHRLLYSYFSFEYAQALAQFHTHFREYRSELIKFSFLLQFNKSKKVRLVYLVKIILGIRSAVFMLSLHRRRKLRKLTAIS